MLSEVSLQERELKLVKMMSWRSCRVILQALLEKAPWR